MPEDSKITDGLNDRASSETIAGTGPGIPDEALGPGRELPTPPSEEEVAQIAEALGVPTPELSDSKVVNVDSGERGGA